MNKLCMCDLMKIDIYICDLIKIADLISSVNLSCIEMVNLTELNALNYNDKCIQSG